jgi:hypothetical protein
MDGSTLWIYERMEFGRVVLGLEACLRQPDRNDDAALLVAFEKGRDQRL